MQNQLYILSNFNKGNFFYPARNSNNKMYMLKLKPKTSVRKR